MAKSGAQRHDLYGRRAAHHELEKHAQLRGPPLERDEVFRTVAGTHRHCTVNDVFT